MLRVAQARRIAVTAAFGSGGVGLLGAGAAGLLLVEARLARRWIGTIGQAPGADGVYESASRLIARSRVSSKGARSAGGTGPLRLALLGDSSAAGLGVTYGHQTPGALLAAGLAQVSKRPVDLRTVALSGAESTDLDRQVPLALEHRPDAAVIMIGANDVTHRVRPQAACRALQQAVRQLRSAGCEVVVGTCPDLGTVEPIRQPLRWVARRLSRQLAAAQTIVAVEAGARSVSLGDILGPEFAARPGEMFSTDRFHPSAAGYAAAATVLLPSLVVALGLGPDEDQPEAARDEAVLPVAVAAVEAADEAGTEVAAVQVGGRDRGPRGRWALLRHRRRRALPRPGQVTGPAADPADGRIPAGRTPQRVETLHRPGASRAHT